MVSVFLCGIDGSGKSQLYRQLAETRCLKDARKIQGIPQTILKNLQIVGRDALQEDDVNVQQRIIEEQSRLEKFYSDSGETILSDHTVIDPLVHASLRLKDDNTLLSKSPQVHQSLSLYKKSLVILLSPFQFEGDSLTFSSEDQEKAIEQYRTILRKFCVPFLFLNCSNVESGLDTVSKALQGELPLPTSSLSSYGKNAQPQSSTTTNFSFFISKPSGKDCVRIPSIKIFEHRYEQGWKTWEKGECNRFIARHGADKLAILAFDINVRSTAVHKMLLGGITINGDMYSFLGCSSSGLKKRNCFMWKGPQTEADKIIKENGDFEKMSVSKRMARISLLFSAINLTNVAVGEENVVKEQDLFTEDGKCFTDGCGGISKDLATDLFEEVRSPSESESGTPDVFQIRYQGYKGVLALDPNLEGKSIKVRPSMRKFVTTVHHRIGVCGYSKPLTFGHLNRQYIMLLSGLGVSDTVLLEKQKQHFEMIKNMTVEPEYAITALQWQNKFEVAQRLIRRVGTQSTSDDESMEAINKCIRSVQSKLVCESERLRIVIPKSRNIYGVCDPSGALEYGECFLRITDGNLQSPRTIKGSVVVCKNPCYLLGDVRVLRAVDDTDRPDVKHLNHLVDCIVFPVRGERPHPDEIAGSDLDGDMFFVSWDSDLIPPSTKPPYSYPGANIKPQGPATIEKTLKYFSVQNETQKLTGKVDKYFRLWADAKGVSSDECQRLGMLFSRVIDSAKSGEKLNLKDLPIPPEDSNSEQKFVWQELEKNAKQFRHEFQTSVLDNRPGFPNASDVNEEFVESILLQEMSNISEFAKFQFVWSFIESHCESVEDIAPIIVMKYADHINFALFTIEQKREAVGLGIPAAVIANALNKSQLLAKDDIKEFNMNSPGNTWKFYFREDHETFQWEYLLKALTQHDRCLLVLRLPDQVTVAVQFLTRCSIGKDQQMDSGTVSGYLCSSKFGYRGKYILGSDCRLELTNDVLQLYRLEKSRTFVCLKASDFPRGLKSAGLDDETKVPISVDLLSFDRRISTGPRRHPLVNKIPFIKIEVFVEISGDSVPYFDTAICNDIESVMEAEDLEEEDDSEDNDLSFLYDGVIDCNQSETEANFKAALRGTITACNCQLMLFERLLNNWFQNHGSTTPEFVSDLAIELVEKIVLVTVPLREEFPQDIVQAIRNVIQMQNFQDPLKIFKLAGLLLKLHLEDVAVSLIVENYGKCMFLFLDVICEWQTWWFIKHDIAKQIIQSVAQATLRKRDETLSNVVEYVLNLGQLHLQDLLLDMKNAQDRMGTAKPELSIANLKMQDPDDEKWERVSFTRPAALVHRLKMAQGQYVSITRQTDFRRNPSHESCCCLAQVKELRTAPLTITVKILGGVPLALKRSLSKPRLWKIDLIANITTFTRVVDALKKMSALKEPLPPLLEIITDPSQCNSPMVYRSLPHDLKDTNTLNPKQQEAVLKALQNTVTLIQGPPGTGKTTVACEIIKKMKQIENHGEGKLLVVSETNIAVDNIVKSLRNDLPFEILRIGTEEGVDKDVYDLTLEGQLMRLEETEGTKTSYRDDQGVVHRKKNTVKRIFKNASVILTTCAGAGDFVLEPYTFDFVLVDEATQTKETTLLCSLMHGAQQIVMIGDPKQLGPTITCDRPDPLLPDLPHVSALSKTLFHRLNTTMSSILLETQHRMHPELANFPSEEFYEGRLKTGITVESRPPPLFPWPEKGKPLCFIDVPHGREEKLGTSFCNKQEITVVQKVVDELLNVSETDREQRLSITDIGILTFYQGQAGLLSTQIKPKVEVRSIDGFQGREKEVIIVSTVRSNDHRSLGFTDSPNRMNVMLTRAKRGLIVLGSMRTLSESDLWKRWLNTAPKINLQ